MRSLMLVLVAVCTILVVTSFAAGHAGHVEHADAEPEFTHPDHPDVSSVTIAVAIILSLALAGLWVAFNRYRVQGITSPV